MRLRKADLENPVFIAGLLRDGHRDLESGMAVFRQALTKLAPAQRLVELFTGLRGKRSRLLVEWLERALQAKVLVGGTRPPVRLDEGLLSALAKLRVQQQ